MWDFEDEFTLYMDEYEYEVVVRVNHYTVVKGDPNCWDSADDYRGYMEVDWDILQTMKYDLNEGGGGLSTFPDELMDDLEMLVNERVLDHAEQDREY